MRINPRDPSQVKPLMCERNWCIYCAPIMGWCVGAAIALARPDQFVTLTLTPPTWEETRHCMEMLRQRLQRPRCGFRLEWAYTREIGRFGGEHVHAWVHGDALPCAEEWEAEALVGGLGRPHVRPTSASRSLYYGQKLLVDAAALPEEDAQISVDRFLGLNNGRLVHPSRRFWRDSSGHPLGTRDRAIKVALGRSPDEVQWVITREDSIAETQEYLRRTRLR